MITPKKTHLSPESDSLKNEESQINSTLGEIFGSLEGEEEEEEESETQRVLDFVMKSWGFDTPPVQNY